MTLYFQKKDIGLKIIYIASYDMTDPNRQIVGALRLHGISQFDAPGFEDFVEIGRKLDRPEPDLNSITRYKEYTRYSSVNLPPQHTQCIIESPRIRNKGIQSLIVLVNSWLNIPPEKLQIYLQRSIINELYRNGIQEKESIIKDIPSRCLDPSKPFTSSSDPHSYA